MLIESGHPIHAKYFRAKILETNGVRTELNFKEFLVHKWTGSLASHGAQREIQPMIPGGGMFPDARVFNTEPTDKHRFFVEVFPKQAAPCEQLVVKTLCLDPEGKFSYLFVCARRSLSDQFEWQFVGPEDPEAKTMVALVDQVVRMRAGRPRSSDITREERVDIFSKIHRRLPIQQRNLTEERRGILEQLKNRGISGRSCNTVNEIRRIRGDRPLLFDETVRARIDEILSNGSDDEFWWLVGSIEALQSESGVTLSQYEAADNVDLVSILPFGELQSVVMSGTSHMCRADGAWVG